MILINLCVLEITLSILYFQRNSQFPFAIIHLWHIAKITIHRKILVKPIGIFESDPVFGYSHIANSRGNEKTPDYEVTYTIGNNKERYIPISQRPQGKILFLGCSHTFGEGVEDDENYPYLLSKIYWLNWHIENKAVMGWGTSHAYMLLSQEIESDNPPSAVIYGMIPNHITRNYIRKSWVKRVAQYNREHPHFELIDGNLIFQGLVNVANSKEDNPELHNKEVEMTISFLVGIRNMCKQKRIPFIVILLPQGRLTLPYVIIRTLVENKIPFLDLSEMKNEGFPHDGHPNRNDHKRIAQAISKSSISEILQSLPKE